jgi:UDP-2,4-diacetamido-2,4,6-trideoxy-beta-L-altropyranose hydrolase
MSNPKVFIRADGNSEIGLGHVIRSLALAEMLKEEFDCIFVTRFVTDYINTEAHEVCKDVIKLPEADEHFETFLSLLSGNEIVVLDNYFFTTEYQQKIKDKGCKLVCIDDMHDKHFVADVVINHGGGVKKEDYSTEPYTQLYLGTEYAIIRPEFLKQKSNADSSSILICFGGSDIHNATLEALNLLEEKQFSRDCHVVTGDAFLYQQKLGKFIETSELKINAHNNLSAREMANLMTECRYAICQPSTVSYEYLSRRGGELYLKLTADNQKDIYDFYIESGIAFAVSELFVEDKSKIKESEKILSKYFDGKSSERIRTIFKMLESERKLILRKANMSDMNLFFGWINEPESRNNALNPKIITYEEHVSWFTAKLLDKGSYLWVLEQHGVPCGQVRFDTNIIEKQAIVSYFIEPVFRGKGLGLTLLKMGIEKIVFENKEITLIKGFVKKTNTASCNIFNKLNFKITKENNSVSEGFEVAIKTLNR